MVIIKACLHSAGLLEVAISQGHQGGSSWGLSHLQLPSAWGSNATWTGGTGNVMTAEEGMSNRVPPLSLPGPPDIALCVGKCISAEDWCRPQSDAQTSFQQRRRGQSRKKVVQAGAMPPLPSPPGYLARSRGRVACFFFGGGDFSCLAQMS